MKKVYFCFATPALLMSCQSVPPNAGFTASSSSRSCASAASTQEVAQTVRAFFAALAIDDETALRRLTTSDFYAFEIGKRYTGPELWKLIADTHKSGRTMQWNIGTVDARVDRNIAFAAWENTGAAGTAAKMEPRA